MKNNKKITLIVINENETKTLNVKPSFLNFIKPFILFGFPSTIGLIIFLSFSFSFMGLHYFYFKKNHYIYSKAQHKLVSNYKFKAKELEITKQKLLNHQKEILQHQKEIIESKEDLQKLKNYLKERGIDIKPRYKSELGKISLNRQNVGGPLNLDKSYINLVKQINNVSVDISEIKTMYDVIKKIPTGYPYFGIITSLFGYRSNPISKVGREFHRGLDIKGNYGDDIMATADGVVIFAGSNNGYGNVIKVKNGFGYSTVYAHLSKINVKIGQKVKAGQSIGKMGSTGRSTGVHLHYEVRKNDEPIDPELFLVIE